MSMDSKEEISDTDSGIILQSGLDSPTSPTKDAAARTQAAKLRQQALQDRLEECLVELKKVCIREAELTGHLSSDYPLLPGEEPPVIRRRVGTAFKLDEESILQGDEHPELGPLEAELALQLQIYEAARKLYQEEHLSKSVRRSRLQQCRVAERRVRELQEAAFRLRLRLGRGSPHPPRHEEFTDLGTSDDTSLSDEDEVPSQVSNRSREASPVPDPLRTVQGPPQTPPHVPQFPPLQVLGELKPCHTPTLDYDRPPIQNTPWKESSLDEPYQKPKKKSRSGYNSQASSPAVTPMSTPTSTPVSTPVDPYFGNSVHPLQFAPIKSLEFCHTQSSSAPCTPELQLRRQQSLSFRFPDRELSQEADQPRGRPRLARRRVMDFGAALVEHVPLQGGLGSALYPSSSEDSSSEYSAPSYRSCPCCDSPMEPISPRLSPYAQPYTGPLGGPLAYARSHGGPLDCTSPNGGPQGYSNPHRAQQGYSNPHRGPQGYANPHGGPPGYATPHGGSAGYAGPHIRPQDFIGPHGGPLAYAGPHDGPQAYSGPSFYKNPMHQSSPSFYRGYIEDDLGYPLEMDMGRLYLCPPPPSGPPGRYEHWYEEVPPRQMLRPLTPHPRLARAPSLREHPPHPAGGGRPHNLAAEGLKSWHQRHQQREPRPRSLDRQGAVRVRSAQERESPLALPPRQHRQPPHQYQEQVPQRQILQRAPDGSPVQWFMLEESEIASQV